MARQNEQNQPPLFTFIIKYLILIAVIYYYYYLNIVRDSSENVFLKVHVSAPTSTQAFLNDNDL